MFTEGQTERILVRESLFRLFDPAKLSFECFELVAHDIQRVPYRYPNRTNPHTEVFFMLVDVHGDESVLSAIRERECNLIDKGDYDAIIGLRDMYSDAYDKLAHGVINHSVSRRLVQAHDAIIRDMTHPERIKLCYAIMEIEAWILGMYDLFQKIDPMLTADYINQRLSIDLKTIDPQVTFYKPSAQLNSILSLCGREYSKKLGEVEAICSRIEISDLDDIVRNNRCKSFGEFRLTIVGNS